jgi:hypothetical protein
VAAVTITPASGSITAAMTVCKINATSTDANDASAYNASAVPTEPELRYYFEASKSGTDSLVSHVFAPSADGDHEWDSVIFPEAGAWTLDLKDASDDSVVATTAVTVS